MATQAQLTEAKAALHKLLTGRSVASVTIDGVQTQYNQASIPSLKAYIEMLESELGIKSVRRRGPAGVY